MTVGNAVPVMNNAFEGSNVILTALTPEDVAQIFVWANDVELAHLNGPYRPTDLMSHNLAFGNLAQDPSKAFFAIRGRKDRRLLGYIKISAINPVFRSAEIGILIGNALDRGQGYGGEALRLAAHFCWNDLNLHRLSMLVCGENQTALKAYAKAGFAVEGVMKEAAFINGRYLDVTILGCLAKQAA